MNAIKRDLRHFKIALGALILLFAAGISTTPAYAANEIVNNWWDSATDAYGPGVDNYGFEALVSGTATSAIIYPVSNFVWSGTLSIYDETAGSFVATSTSLNINRPAPEGNCITSPELCAYQINFDENSNFITGHWYTYRTIAGTGTPNFPISVLYKASGINLFFIRISSAAPDNNIEIIAPPDATSTPDFGNWILNWYAIAPTSTYVQVNYGAATSSWTFSDQSGAGSENENNGVVFPKYNLLSNGHYYAQANLFEYDINYNKIYLATSTLISFDIISGQYITFIEPPTSTASSSEWVITCDPNSGLFEKSMCYLLQYLFVPKQENLNKFGNLKDFLTIKPPVGYFYAIKNVLANIGATSTPAFDISTSTAALAPVLSPLKTGITSVLWVWFGVIVFNRIKKLDL